MQGHLLGQGTDARARAAADQLVRLTRLLVRAEDQAGAAAVPQPRGGGATAAPRRMRHNQVEMTVREQRVLGLLAEGRYDEDLAGLLDISTRAVADHLRALLHDFDPDFEPGHDPGHGSPAAQPPPRGTRRRRATALLAPVTGTVMLGGAAVVAMMTEDPVRPAAPRGPAVSRPADPANPLIAYGVAARRPGNAARPGGRPEGRPGTGRPSRLPRGIATATSFWDPATARGARMKYRTLASPYWPLGTKVRVTYGDRTAVGVVEDFGPADWAIAQHDIPAIIDISEKMMADLTGARVHAVRVGFEVLKWGKGEIYRSSGPGHDLATGRSKR